MAAERTRSLWNCWNPTRVALMPVVIWETLLSTIGPNWPSSYDSFSLAFGRSPTDVDTFINKYQMKEKIQNDVERNVK
jgi:hypothetical protein